MYPHGIEYGGHRVVNSWGIGFENMYRDSKKKKAKKIGVQVFHAQLRSPGSDPHGFKKQGKQGKTKEMGYDGSLKG